MRMPMAICTTTMQLFTFRFLLFNLYTLWVGCLDELESFLTSLFRRFCTWMTLFLQFVKVLLKHCYLFYDPVESS